jgi:proline racemase
MVRTIKTISTIDSHTAGEGTRLVMSGLPPILGQTMAEKLTYAREHLSWAPGLLLLEPRGHKDLFGAIMVPPCSITADFGVLFMDNEDYEPMCGHAVIGIVTSLLETGMFEIVEPDTLITLDTPSGLVRTHARILDSHVQSVSFENVPAFVYRPNVALSVPDMGTLVVDIVFGGLFFALVNAQHLGIDLIPDNAARLADLGMRILKAANEQVPVRHPELPYINRIIDLRFYMELVGDGADSRNVVILGDHMIDRSPCGTGTSAEVALRYARGQLGLNEQFVTESIIRTRFTAQVLAETLVGSGSETLPAVIPKITGSAYVTGFHQFILDGEDPFPNGFLLKA